MTLDVLIYGGGAAGLWTLDTLTRAGWACALVEKTALGAGQTIQSQGIIHGGGKYALRGVRDFDAVKAIREMPALWRECFAGKRSPDLSRAKLASQECLLWVPRGGLLANVASKGVMAIIEKAGLLATKPVALPKEKWPAPLKDALDVYTMAEPVVDTASFLEALAAPHRKRIRLGDDAALRKDARAIVYTAGAGNEELAAGSAQRRPLLMFLVRGKTLPALFGHCVSGGKTRLTVTTPAPGVWQVGGEVAERNASGTDLEEARRDALGELRQCLPALDLAGCEIATYAAVRAEAKTKDARRPSGVHVAKIDARTFAAWPTKLALAPALADEVLAQVASALGKPAGYNAPLPEWPSPAVATPPWEEASWFPIR